MLLIWSIPAWAIHRMWMKKGFSTHSLARDAITHQGPRCGKLGWAKLHGALAFGIAAASCSCQIPRARKVSQTTASISIKMIGFVKINQMCFWILHTCCKGWCSAIRPRRLQHVREGWNVEWVSRDHDDAGRENDAQTLPWLVLAFLCQRKVEQKG